MHLCVTLGWRWEEVEELTIPRLRALRDYFEEFPPVHVTLASLAGLAGRRGGSRPVGAATAAMLEALLAGGAAGLTQSGKKA